MPSAALAEPGLKEDTVPSVAPAEQSKGKTVPSVVPSEPESQGTTVPSPTPAELESKGDTMPPVQAPPQDTSKPKIMKAGTFPEGLTGPNQYGISIKRLAVMLYVVVMGSLGKIVAILKPFLLCPSMSTGSVWTWVQEMAQKVQPTVEAIGRAALNESYVCVDETGGDVNGITYWIHCVCTKTYTFMSLQDSRGLKGMLDMGFLDIYMNTVMHDCLSVYFGFDFIHILCNEHLSRDLKALSDHFRNCREWATQMIQLLLEIKEARESLIAQKVYAFTAEELKKYKERFLQIIEEGKKLHPLPEKIPGKRGAPKKGRARALLDRMENHAEEFLGFMYDFSLPYCNNEAERPFRSLKSRFKISGAFRDFEGGRRFCPHFLLSVYGHQNGQRHF